MTTLSDGKACCLRPMTGHNLEENCIVEPIDQREDEAGYEINPVLSSPDFNFSAEDPAVDHPDPLPGSEHEAIAPAWNREGAEI